MKTFNKIIFNFSAGGASPRHLESSPSYRGTHSSQSWFHLDLFSRITVQFDREFTPVIHWNIKAKRCQWEMHTDSLAVHMYFSKNFTHESGCAKNPICGYTNYNI